ncbi:MAG: lysophospholipid acyltransferase family protein [Bacteroidia bacterium]|jgi:1-acyl-sn-glycerol-3-phosphate acyltransferase|nr:lysophospholipid acyltransferase family protein [Bacteroidia bacterium]
MLYSLFWILFRITFRIFFREAVVHNRERIPPQGPLLICANHPGALLDPMVIAALLGRRVHFLAKAVAFKTKFAQWLLPRLNMIPIYRKQDDPSQTHRNEETFVKCYEQLAKGAAILIFPEGISITERKLRELKTGAARIVLGAEEANNYTLNIQVLAVGLNYDDPHSFGRNVLIQVAEPIAVSNYTAQWQTDKFAAADALTEEIRRRLEAQIIHIENDEDDRLVKQVERLHGDELRRKRNLPPDSAPHEFRLTQRIAAVVQWFRTHDNARLDELRSGMSSYFWKLEALGLSDRALRSSEVKPIHHRFVQLLAMLAGFPFYVCGLLLNIVPFFIAHRLSQTLVKQREFQGAVGAVTGALLFLIWYVLLAVLTYTVWKNGWLAAGIVVMAVPAGLFAWYYHLRIRSLFKRSLLGSLFKRRRVLILELIRQREELISQLEQAEAWYRSKTQQQ